MKGTMRIMDQTGDSIVTWEITNDEQVEAARKVFNEFLDKNYTAYRTAKGDVDRSPVEGKAVGDSTPASTSRTDGELIKQFDRDASEIILAVPLIGG